MPNNGSSPLSAATTAISEGKSGDNNPVISAEKLKQLYAAMLESRLTVEQMRRSSGKRGTAIDFHGACEVGCTIELRPADTVVLLPHQPSRYFGAKLARGGNFTTNHANEAATTLRRDAPSLIRFTQAGHSPDQLAVATGVAFAYAAQRSTSVVVAFAERKQIKDSQGSISYAQERCLPIIYVELADRYGGSHNPARRGHKSGTRVVTMPVDRSDVIAIYRVACEAIDKARRGAGPSLIQCVRYEPRSQGKPSTGSHTIDPIAYMEHYLRKKNLWSHDFKRAIEQAFAPD